MTTLGCGSVCLHETPSRNKHATVQELQELEARKQELVGELDRVKQYNGES